MSASKEAKILQVWHDNAAPWCTAIAERRLPSRVAGTDRAIVEAVLEQRPQTVLDIGCGEGWLLRTLVAQGITGTGVDAVAAFAQSVRASGATFVHATYEAVMTALAGQQFDLLVANFSLLGDQSSAAVVSQAPALLRPGGVLLIQTLHPDLVADAEYGDGWRAGTWAGAGPDFGEPAPWYFRTEASWRRLLAQAGFNRIALDVPRCRDTGAALSWLFCAQDSSTAGENPLGASE